MPSSASPFDESIAARLVLGGHSFISQLGSDPAAPDEDQLAIVEACLDAGIRAFDTTYQPERIALGRILETLGRRDEARIFAWNFFTDFQPGERVGKDEAFQSHHMQLMLDQLRTSHVDCLVVVPQRDDGPDRRQLKLMTEWRRQGYARSLGLWIEDLPPTSPFRESGQLEVAVRPFNVTMGSPAVEDLAHFRRLGWETLATSPFFRGWELERILAAAGSRYGAPDPLRARLADLMLRHALYQSGADRVVVAMRQVTWIRANLESVARGLLAEEERRELRKLRRLAEPPWWHRLRRPRRLLAGIARRAGLR